MQVLLKTHRLGIIHRDIKPENILLEEGCQVVLADFGFAITKQELLAEQVYTRVGTLEFYPIEMLAACFPEQGRQRIIYDERVDIWSMGVVLYELLYGQTPFFTGKDEDTKTRIRALSYSFPHPGKFPEAEDLFRRIFKRPQERISLAEIVKHPFYCKQVP